MSKWEPPIRAPQQVSPARLEPLPLEVTCRDLDSPGAPIRITKPGIEYVERLAKIGQSDTGIAHAFRIDRSTFREIKRRQPEVGEALAAGRAGLFGELMNNLLIASRAGDTQATTVLLRHRFGGDGSPVNSAQGDKDDEAEETEKPINLDAASFAERSLLLLALNRIQELQDGPDDKHGHPHVLASDRPRLAALIEAYGRMERGRGVPGYVAPETLLALLQLDPPPTVEDFALIAAVRMTPHERRLALASGAEPIEQPIEPIQPDPEGDPR